jgi:hypothetical protein
MMLFGCVMGAVVAYLERNIAVRLRCEILLFRLVIHWNSKNTVLLTT